MITEAELLAGMNRQGRRAYLRGVEHKRRIADVQSKRKAQEAKA